jgi:hypothetical protein
MTPSLVVDSIPWVRSGAGCRAARTRHGSGGTGSTCRRAASAGGWGGQPRGPVCIGTAASSSGATMQLSCTLAAVTGRVHRSSLVRRSRACSGAYARRGPPPSARARGHRPGATVLGGRARSLNTARRSCTRCGASSRQSVRWSATNGFAWSLPSRGYGFRSTRRPGIRTCIAPSYPPPIRGHVENSAQHVGPRDCAGAGNLGKHDASCVQTHPGDSPQYLVRGVTWAASHPRPHRLEPARPARQ